MGDIKAWLDTSQMYALCNSCCAVATWVLHAWPCGCALQAWRLKPSLRKLQRSRSLIMGTYYGFLWAITILNLFRCILQMARNGTSSTHASLWNALWLVTRFGECAAHMYLQQQVLWYRATQQAA